MRAPGSHHIDSHAEGSQREVRRDLSSLQFRVESFREEHLPLVEAFAEKYWSRPRTPSFYRWRYLESLPFSRMFLALTHDECLGMIFAFRKPYLIAGREVPCLEIFDWHSLPGLSGSGIGIRVMRAMMRLNERLLGIGGTPEAQKALPAMGWQTVATASSYELPMSGEVLADGLRKRMPVSLPAQGLLLNAAVATWFRPRRRDPLGHVMPVATLGDAVEALYAGGSGYDVVQMPCQPWLRWLTGGYPGAGGFRFWYFYVGGRLRGWVLTRVYDTADGREASLVDLYAQNPDPSLYTWMVSEAAVSLSGERPRVIRARATCPILQRALRANRFREGDPVQVYTWPQMPPAATRLHITLNHTDSCLRPYPPPELPEEGE